MDNSELPPPPPPSHGVVYRSINEDYWQGAIKEFDGVHASIAWSGKVDNDFWLYTIENRYGVAYRIIRCNGNVVHEYVN